MPVSSAVVGPPKGWHDNLDDYAKIDLRAASWKQELTLPEAVSIPPSPVFSSKGQLLETRAIEEYEASPAVIFRIIEGRFYSDPMAVILPDDRVLAGPSQWFGDKPEDHWIFQKLWLGRARKLQGEVLIFCDSGGNYYHFIFDVLVRLWLLKVAGRTLSSFDWIVIPGYGDRFVRPILDQLGVKREKIIFAPSSTHLAPEMMTILSPNWFPGRWVLRAIDETFEEVGFIGRSGSSYPKRLYVSRRSAKVRRVLNEDEVLLQLTPLGFVPVYLETLDSGTQRELFRQAEMIVAPHGAGLTNVVFCQKGARILELRHKSHRDHHWDVYRRLAQLAGVDYACMSVDDSPFTKQRAGKAAERDITVPLEGLRAISKVWFQ